MKFRYFYIFLFIFIIIIIIIIIVIIIINYHFIIIFTKSADVMNLAEIKVIFEPERNWFFCLNAERRKQGGRNFNP